MGNIDDLTVADPSKGKEKEALVNYDWATGEDAQTWEEERAEAEGDRAREAAVEAERAAEAAAQRAHQDAMNQAYDEADAEDEQREWQEHADAEYYEDTATNGQSQT